MLTQQVYKSSDERLGNFWARRIDEIRAAAAPRVGVERKLRNNQCCRTFIEGGEVELAGGIFEDAKGRDLLREVTRVALVVVMRDADEDHQARANNPNRFFVDDYGRFTNALNHRAHFAPLPYSSIFGMILPLESKKLMVKLLMTWDIRPGKESEYFEFVVQEFAPKLVKLGVQPTEAWYTVYGEAPQILTGAVTEDRKTMDAILNGEEWQTLRDKLLNYVNNFNYKIVTSTGNFQL